MSFSTPMLRPNGVPPRIVKQLRTLSGAQSGAFILQVFDALMEDLTEPDKVARLVAMRLIADMKPEALPTAQSAWKVWCRCVQAGQRHEAVRNGIGWLTKNPAFHAGTGKRGWKGATA